MPRLAAKQAGLFDLTTESASTSSLIVGDSRRIRLPRDLSASLIYVDNDELERLREAVSSEIKRRHLSLRQTESAVLSAPTARRSAHRNKERELKDIPIGKVSLIHASFRAGLKPAAIARNLRISPSLVRDVLNSARKAKR